MRVVQEVEVAVYIPLDVRARGLLGAAYELGQLLFGDGGVHPTSLVMACSRGPEVGAKPCPTWSVPARPRALAATTSGRVAGLLC